MNIQMYRDEFDRIIIIICIRHYFLIQKLGGGILL